MDKKFELTNETLEYCGRTLHRIKALKDFGSVKKCDFGGWVEKEKNLSQEGYCWIYSNAKVGGNALVSDNAIVGGNANVYGNATVFGNARVCDNAQVGVYAKVSGNANVYGFAQVGGFVWVRGNAQVGGCANIQYLREYLTVGPVGRNSRFMTFYRTNEGEKEDVGVICGCFIGTLGEFEKKVEETHGDNEFGKQYKNLIEFARVRFGLSKRLGWLGRLFQQLKRKGKENQ